MNYILNDELSAQILTNMLDNTDPNIDQREGTPTYTSLAPAADEMANLYAELKAQEDADFIVDTEGNVTMYGMKLDLFAAAWGETRKEGGKATGAITVSADQDTPVPAGTRVFAPATINVLFEINEDVIATTTGAIVPITAVSEGSDGNVSSGSITGVVGDLEGMITVTNILETAGGFDEESDEEFATRFLNNRRNPATSGNIFHYQQWATSVPGITDAYVIPAWDGGGTVKVVVLSSDYDAPTPEKVQEVADYIETERPVNVAVTVEAATEVTLDVVMTIVTDEETTDIEAGFRLNAEEYLRTISFQTGGTVRIIRLENAVLDAGDVTDITSFTVNGGTTNITIPAGSTPVIGTVTINVSA